jgi:hypothetical protein
MWNSESVKSHGSCKESNRLFRWSTGTASGRIM